MLDEILKSAQPGVNPELEQMIARLMQGSGSTAKQASQAVAPMQPTQTSLGTSAAPGAQQANETYQLLVKRGVPPELATQAMGNPQLLQDLLAQLFKADGPNGPQEMPPAMAGGTANRMSAPAPQSLVR